MNKSKSARLPRVTLKSGAVRRVSGRYPFGHAGDIAEADTGIEAGQVVQVCEPNGRALGAGYFNQNGQTPLRMLAWEAETQIDQKFYRARIRQAVQKRAGRIQDTNAMRVIHAEADGLPGIVADQFGDVLSIQFRNAGVERHREWIIKALKDELEISAAYERSDTAERRKEGLELKTGTLWGEVPEVVSFFEDDLELHFSPFDAQKTGFFLDQRDNRRLMRTFVQSGQSFLDVYSYTGSFALHAAKAGAKSTAIDKDNVALGVLEREASQNGVSVNLRWGDALEQLKQIRRDGQTFQAAVIDPPTLAKRKDDIPKAKRIFTEAAEHVLEMLAVGGHLLISTCAHYIRVEDLLDASRIAASRVNTDAEVMAITYQPADHPHLLSVPESLYLKSILLRKG